MFAEAVLVAMAVVVELFDVGAHAYTAACNIFRLPSARSLIKRLNRRLVIDVEDVLVDEDSS